jgi:adenine-specific DNA-methyltransferase
LQGKPNAVVLDFFAGSGTTGHAILRMNNIEKSNRTFILCTNNENGICEEVCYPRIFNVINGYKDQKKREIEGLNGNLKYYKTAFVKRTLSADSLKIRITRECTEMLCLRESIFEEFKKTDNYSIFKNNNNIMGVYYSLESDELKSLKVEFDKINLKKILYCFTLDPLGLDKKDFSDWKDVTFEPIPQKILEIYKRIYEY